MLEFIYVPVQGAVPMATPKACMEGQVSSLKAQVSLARHGASSFERPKMSWHRHIDQDASWHNKSGVSCGRTVSI